MKNLNISVIALAVGFFFSMGVMAKSMSDDEYKFLDKNIGAEYRVAKNRCLSLAGNANDKCVAEAREKKNIAKQNLDIQYKAIVTKPSEPATAKTAKDRPPEVVKG